MTTVLVTGGAGYVGSHACKALARAGFRPVTFDSLERGHRDAVLWGPLIQGDLRDPGSIREAIDAVRPAAVMHFAAYANVGESVDRPDAYHANNVGGSLNLLRAMIEFDVGALVFSSTCAVYGTPAIVPIEESSERNPINPYGRSKLIVELILEDCAAAGRARSISLRYFNAAGADPAGEIGERHDPETHLIPLALDTAAGSRDRLNIYGDDYPTPDGTCVRDYIHVCDLADAHVAALQALLDGARSNAFNLGTGEGSSVSQVVRTVEQVTGQPVPATITARRPGDPPILVADAARARRELSWRPKYSDLATIVETAHAFRRGRALSGAD